MGVGGFDERLAAGAAPTGERRSVCSHRRSGASREGLKAMGVGGCDERLAAGAAPTAEPAAARVVPVGAAQAARGWGRWALGGAMKGSRLAPLLRRSQPRRVSPGRRGASREGLGRWALGGPQKTRGWRRSYGSGASREGLERVRFSARRPWQRRRRSGRARTGLRRLPSRPWLPGSCRAWRTARS